MKRRFFLQCLRVGWLLCAVAVVTACRPTAGWIEVSGQGAPAVDALKNMQRLSACQDAQNNARRALWDQVRELPWTDGMLVGDWLAMRPRPRARVINYVYAARVVSQKYEPKTKLATVVMVCDPVKVYELLHAAP